MAQPTEKQRIGALGEGIAAKYLENKGFAVIGRNYLRKCGEIDIIAKKGKILHFIEVKSVSRESSVGTGAGDVSRETDDHRPEDNIHPAKLKRLARTIEVYLLDKFPASEPKWQFDAITVKIEGESRRAYVKYLEDIIL